MQLHTALFVLGSWAQAVSGSDPHKPWLPNGESPAQLVDEDENWMASDRQDGTFGLGGRSVLATWNTDGGLRLKRLQRAGRLQNYSHEWMPPVPGAGSLDVDASIRHDGSLSKLGLDLPANEGYQLSFEQFVKQARWDLAMPNARIWQHGLSQLIAQLTPFLEQEHPVEVKPCRQKFADIQHDDCNRKIDGTDFKGKRRKGDAFLIDVSVFGFDLDMLELKLLELQDVVDLFVVIEMPLTHKATPKPLLWARNKDSQRFAKFSSQVLHIVIDDEKVLEHLKLESSNNQLLDVQWDKESAQEDEGIRKLRQLITSLIKYPVDEEREIIINYGDTDEIASPRNLQILKSCQPSKFPVDHGVWMIEGRLNKAFMSDFPVKRELPYTYGNPCSQTVQTLKGRCFGSSGNYLLGGWHMTGYPYLPHVVMKKLTGSEYTGMSADEIELLREGRDGLEKYYMKTDIGSDPRMFLKKMWLWELKKQALYKERPELLEPPCTIRSNPERYEAWFGSNDRRLKLAVPQLVEHRLGAFSEIFRRGPAIEDSIANAKQISEAMMRHEGNVKPELENKFVRRHSEALR